MYYNAQPPYFLVVAGLFIGITCGLAFKATLEQSVQAWSKTRSSRLIAAMRGFQLFVPFLGIGIGICIFLSAGLSIFGIPNWFACGFSFPTTALTLGLLWLQLGRLLEQLERGGSKALDLDSLF